MHDSTEAPIVQVNNSAMSGYESVSQNISNHSLYEMWSQLFCHYCDAHTDTAVKRPNGEAKFSTRSTLKQFMVK